jgi:hypothetical protein
MRRTLARIAEATGRTPTEVAACLLRDALEAEQAAEQARSERIEAEA